MSGETLLTVLEDSVQDRSRGMTRDDQTACYQHVRRNAENSCLAEYTVTEIVIGKKVKQSCYRPGVAQSVIGKKVKQSCYRPGVAQSVIGKKVKQSRYRPGVAQSVIGKR
jgi:hypothetical protein